MNSGPDQPANLTRVLLVSSSATLRRSLRERLPEQRWIVREAESGSDALEKLMDAESDVLLLDGRLPDLRPEEFSRLVAARFSRVQLLSLNAQAGQLGTETSASSQILSELGEVIHTWASPLMGSVPQPPFPALRRPVTERQEWQGMVGSSAAMQRIFHAIRLVARRDTSVLITGESGTGKDLVARALHFSSTREKQPFVVINCAAIPETLLEAELFGYTKGAFTGAVQSRIGRIHAAHGGTLFLDEIGEMPVSLQSKLLRFLEQGEVQRIGGSDTLKVDVRVVAATNADLKKLASQSLFREDLYYRLAVFPIALPPLREHMEDLDSLIESFVARFSPGLGLTLEARERLHEHSWPGNVRELRNVLERASLYAESEREIRSEDILF